MKSKDDILKRIGVLTATMGNLQEQLYDLALEGKQRKCIWKIHELNKKIVSYYREITILEWTIGDD